MGVWDETTPAGTDPRNQGDDRIREMKVALGEALTADGGIFPGPSPATAPVFYPVFLKDAEVNRPVVSTNYPGRLFFNEDTGTIQRQNNAGNAWDDLTKNPATQAIHHKAASALASVAGVVTLPETGNAFAVSGTEEVTSIAGWSAGQVVVQWDSGRNLKNSGTLQLRGGVDRKVVANDISIFIFTGADSVAEISFYGAGMGKEVGESIMWNQDTAPAGFLEENGASLLRADYPGLFSVLGTKHGAADGTHFNIPDSRGRFARGYDHGAGNDPDAAARTAMNAGGDTGDKTGTLQADDYLSHTHDEQLANTGSQTGNAGGTYTPLVHAAAPSNLTAASPATGGLETRPKNTSKMFCIKY